MELVDQVWQTECSSLRGVHQPVSGSWCKHNSCFGFITIDCIDRHCYCPCSFTPLTSALCATITIDSKKPWGRYAFVNMWGVDGHDLYLLSEVNNAAESEAWSEYIRRPDYENWKSVGLRVTCLTRSVNIHKACQHYAVAMLSAAWALHAWQLLYNCISDPKLLIFCVSALSKTFLVLQTLHDYGLVSNVVASPGIRYLPSLLFPFGDWCLPSYIGHES